MGEIQVKTKTGIVRGGRKIEHVVFRGIPYGKAPAGSLRWKRPLPFETWEGIREARVFANRPFAGGFIPGTFYGKEFGIDEDFLPPMSEDCLFLNIWAPAKTLDVKDANDIQFPRGEKLPVAFWIHGGGFVNGHATEQEFDGEAFAKQGVILVTVGHRVGSFGYLAHPWFSKEGGDGSGNYGLYDLIAALDWVYENISAFGGDPEKISVFGQSAGAISVQALISTKLTRGKIKGAVIQSAGGYNPSVTRFRPFEEAEKIGKDFSDFCGVNSLEAFRAIPGEKLVELQSAFLKEWAKTHTGRGPFGPNQDGLLLEDTEYRLLENGLHHDIPYMIGCTANDIGFNRDQAKPGERPPLYQVCTDFSLLNEKLGRHPAWVYYFTHEPQGDNAGAFHSAELWYVFGTLSRSWRPKSPADYALSDRIVSYWCNFFKSGNPNSPELPPWKPHGAGDPFVMELHG